VRAVRDRMPALIKSLLAWLGRSRSNSPIHRSRSRRSGPEKLVLGSGTMVSRFPVGVAEWGGFPPVSRTHPMTRCVHLGLLSLPKRYGPLRLEVACERALALGTLRYSHVRDSLANNRDQITPQAESDWTSPAHANLRGPGYYQ